MSRRTPQESDASLHIVHPHAAAIDVHSDNHVACVGPGQVRTFGAYSADLDALADWFRAAGVTSVVLESTGVYWIALFELLEGRGFEVFLIEPSQASHCGARPKTDRLDCQWLQRLHTYGLLRPSFRPPDAVLALRGYWRQRQMLVRYASHHVQHMQKALGRKKRGQELFMIEGKKRGQELFMIAARIAQRIRGEIGSRPLAFCPGTPRRQASPLEE